MALCKGFKRVARGWRTTRLRPIKTLRAYGKAPCQNKAGADGFCHAHRTTEAK